MSGGRGGGGKGGGRGGGKGGGKDGGKDASAGQQGVQGILVDDVGSPIVRKPSKDRHESQQPYETQDQYGSRHDAAATQIGKVIKGGHDRKRAANKYHAEGRPPEEALDPKVFGLGAYEQYNDVIPEVSDDRRYMVRDITARHVLLQLGVKAEDLGSAHSFETDSFAVLQDIVKKSRQDLSLDIQKQMEAVRLFTYTDDAAPATPSSASNAPGTRPESKQTWGASAQQADSAAVEAKYLLGKYECLAVPARADFDSAFEQIRTPAVASNAPASISEPSADCGTSGFAGWFWVLHEGAPNIGESDKAEDFFAYSRDDSASNPNAADLEAQNGVVHPCWKEPGRGRGRVLDEDRYLSSMYHLWRLAILSMARLEVDDCLLFPFGMGAFLRHLGKNDDRYLDNASMRSLRLGIAAELMKAIVSVYGELARTGDVTSSQGNGAKGSLPLRLHLCLMCNNAESVENHNVFVEAAGDTAKEYPGIAKLLKIRRNVDVLQLAHGLSSGAKPLKVGILNGCNRKLLGNHWFQKGARYAIDENLHRRSSSMTRAALLLNMGTEPVERRQNELKSTLQWLGGQAEPLPAPNQLKAQESPKTPASATNASASPGASAAKAKAKAKAGAGAGGGGFGCCKRRPLTAEEQAKKKEEEARKKSDAEAKAKAKAEAKAKAKAEAKPKAKPEAKAKAKASA